jgi:Gas vesicle synthesis protein GvpL/GvpF
MPSYVYCFTHSKHPLALDALRGVGAEETALRAVRHDGLAAVVSDAPEGLRPKRRDLVAHETVLETLCAAGPVVPLRFGTVAPDDGAVTDELARGARRYADPLIRLAGHVERNVKGAHQEDALLADLLTANPQLRAGNEALRASGGGSEAERAAFGEQVYLAVEQRRIRDTAYVVSALRPFAELDRHAPAVEGCFMNVSFLIPAEAQGDFDAAVTQLRTGVQGYAELRVSGALPPYSFVDFAEANV